MTDDFLNDEAFAKDLTAGALDAARRYTRARILREKGKAKMAELDKLAESTGLPVDYQDLLRLAIDDLKAIPSAAQLRQQEGE
jgi:hypothetical protein